MRARLWYLVGVALLSLGAGLLLKGLFHEQGPSAAIEPLGLLAWVPPVVLGMAAILLARFRRRLTPASVT